MEKAIKVTHLLMLVGFLVCLVMFNYESSTSGVTLDTATMLLFTQISLLSFWLYRNR
ncbi:hypothetical protein [Marininema halotolerans]|uniref:Uncharacterized protein n=1 Tax=Marininema halotolerans TaxID=1155944 RepID=A0A1I6T0Z9_9BACL|nr:hypothetical protein [Marininema halotolerans]SFS82919.1 hypothetical protein SAMN05444972_108191 [Marininema halotolerans]